MSNLSIKLKNIISSASINSLNSNSLTNLIDFFQINPFNIDESSIDINESAYSNDLSLSNLSIIDYYKNKYIKSKTKFEFLKNQNKKLEEKFEQLKKFYLDIYEILLPNNSNKINSSIIEQIKKIKKIVLKIKEKIIKFNDKDNIIDKNNINEKKINDIIKKEQNTRVFIISVDKKIHYSILCKNTDKFEKIEDLLYNKYPEYKKLENTFILNGNIIDKNKTLEENKIKNGEIIMLYEERNINDIKNQKKNI